MSRVRRNVYQYTSDFDRGRIVADWDCNLSYRNITIRICRDLMTVCRVWNSSVLEGHTKRCAGSQWPTIINRWEDKHLTRMALLDHAAKSRTLSQEMGKITSV